MAPQAPQGQAQPQGPVPIAQSAPLPQPKPHGINTSQQQAAGAQEEEVLLQRLFTPSRSPAITPLTRRETPTTARWANARASRRARASLSAPWTTATARSMATSPMARLRRSRSPATATAATTRTLTPAQSFSGVKRRRADAHLLLHRRSVLPGQDQRDLEEAGREGGVRQRRQGFGIAPHRYARKPSGRPSWSST